MSLIDYDGLNYSGTNYDLALTTGTATFDASGLDSRRKANITGSNTFAKLIGVYGAGHIGVSERSYWGFRWRSTSLYANMWLFQLVDRQASATSNTKLNAIITGTGAITSRYGSTTLSTSANVLAANTWHYIEVMWKCGSTTGEYEIRVDGATVLSGTGQSFGTVGANQLTTTSNNTLSNGGQPTVNIQDIYVVTESGTAPWNTFLGPVAVIVRNPSGDGDATDWTANTGTRWEAVDDGTANPNDSDTTYISSATTGHVSTFDIASITVPTGYTVQAAKVELDVRKDDAAARTVAAVLRRDGTDYAGSAFTQPTTYGRSRTIWTTDPAGGNWANTDFDGTSVTEIGVKVVS